MHSRSWQTHVGTSPAKTKGGSIANMCNCACVQDAQSVFTQGIQLIAAVSESCAASESALLSTTVFDHFTDIEGIVKN